MRGQLYIGSQLKISKAIIAIQSGVMEITMNWELGNLAAGFYCPLSTEQLCNFGQVTLLVWACNSILQIRVNL